MLREFWSTLGMPESEHDCLGNEFTHSKQRREDFLRKFAEEFEEFKRQTLSEHTPPPGDACRH